MTGRPARARALLAALAAVAALAGCGSDGEGGAAPSTVRTSAPSADDFPPNDLAAYQATFDPLLAPLGVRLTRAVLVDRTDGWDLSDTGTHLALYVEPLDDERYTVDDYVANIYEVTAAVVDEVFGPWAGIQTFDVCQEPYRADDDRYEPFPRTQVELTRAQAEAFDWEGGSLADLLTLLHGEDGARLHVDRDVKWSTPYRSAMEAAGLDPDA